MTDIEFNELKNKYEEELKKRFEIDYTYLNLIKTEADKEFWENIGQLKEILSTKQYEKASKKIFKKWWKDKLKRLKEMKISK